MTQAEKVVENRVRRAAARRGYRLRKSRRRDPRALDFGLYAILDPDRNMLVSDYASLADVERWVDHL